MATVDVRGGGTGKVLPIPLFTVESGVEDVKVGGGR